MLIALGRRTEQAARVGPSHVPRQVVEVVIKSSIVTAFNSASASRRGDQDVAEIQAMQAD